MLGRARVVRSINDRGALRCVDIFLRPDGRIGFEEYRRDVEDQRGWFPVGGFTGRVFDSEAGALSGARRAVAWLETALAGDVGEIKR